ncbi:NFACT family protein [bacterium]|nr:NFACT family protein [bacterium]MBU1958045.1 NFACT family protein [bacterium]
MLDESSVWNELLELADLEKSDMKRLKKNEEKIEKLYDELLEADVEEESKTYKEMCDLKGESSKQLMGAV